MTKTTGRRFITPALPSTFAAFRGKSVRYWHLADISTERRDVRYGGKADIIQGKSRHQEMSANDPKRTLEPDIARTFRNICL